MAQLEHLFLAIALLFLACARFAPRAVWPYARDGLGLLFLASWDPRALGAQLAAGLAAWALGRSGRRWAVLSGILAVAAALFIERVLRRADTTGMVLAPAGFGFLVLRLIHYLVERGRGALPEHGPREVLAWLLYFPTVLVGPVQRFDDWLRWERRRRWDDHDAARGLRRVLHGYATVVLLSFLLVGTILPAHLSWLPDGLSAALIGLLTLYLTFSGLSSVAIGLGLVAGQRVPENFDSPLTKTDLPSFWRAWHMTVSEWCRAYVYVPLLAKTRNGRLSAVLGMAAFAMWHELTVAYVAWGAWHALGLGLWYRLAPRTLSPRLRPIGWALTMSWVLVGSWILRAWPRGAAWYAR